MIKTWLNWFWCLVGWHVWEQENTFRECGICLKQQTVQPHYEDACDRTPIYVWKDEPQ